MKIPISVVVIAHNEEKNIGRCLDAVRHVADEIVVVDSFSTDRTEEICLQHGVRFVKQAFLGYAAQKNYANSLAAHDWILSLDADEVLSSALERSILAVKENCDADGYRMNRLSNYCGTWIRHGGWYPDRKLRLWNRRKGQWGGTRLHETLQMQANSRIAFLQGDLLHYTIDTFSQHLLQIDRFTDISAQELFEKGKKATVFHLIFSPLFKFFRDYVFKLGFLDGFHGLAVCTFSAFAKFLKFSKLRQHWRNHDQKIKSRA